MSANASFGVIAYAQLGSCRIRIALVLLAACAIRYLSLPQFSWLVLGADLNCSGSGSGSVGVQVMPMKSMFLGRVPVQKTALDRLWTGLPHPGSMAAWEHRMKRALVGR